MCIYYVDTCCIIYSNKQRINTETYILDNDRKVFFGDQKFIADFFELQRLITHDSHSDDHDNLSVLAKSFHDINAICKNKGKEGWSLMHKVAEKGCALCGEILMTHGANPDISIQDMPSPRQLALKLDHTDLVQTMEKCVPAAKIIAQCACNVTCNYVASVEKRVGTVETAKKIFTACYYGTFSLTNKPEDQFRIHCSMNYETTSYPNTISLAFRIEKIKEKRGLAYRIRYTGEHKIEALYTVPCERSAYFRPYTNKHYFVKTN